MATSFIIDFIQSLSSEEAKVVAKYLSRSKEDKSKIGHLFNLLIKEKERLFSDKELYNVPC